MSQLLPVAGSTSTPSHLAPSDSRWNTRSVILLVGAGAGLALIYTIYYRFMTASSAPSSPVDSRRVSLDSPRDSYTAKQHSSEMTHNGIPCLNEIKKLRFDYFAEGFFKIKLDTVFPQVIIPENENADITVRCSYDDQEFFVHRETISQLSTIEFFMPNLPFQQLMSLTIDYAEASLNTSKTIDFLTIDFLVDTERASYEIKGENCFCTELPAQIETYSHLLPSPRSLETPFDVHFTQDHQVVIRDAPLHASILIDNQSIPTLAYFKIVYKDDEDSENDVAIALPFFFSTSEKKELLPSTLIELWKHAYHQAVEVETLRDLNLVLSEIKLITYIEEESIDSGAESD